MASELHPWRFELEIFPSRLPCGHVFEPKLNAQQGAICEALFSSFFLFFFFRNALSRAHRDVSVPTSLWLGPINSLPFAIFFKGKAWKENSFVNFSLQPLQHTRSACFKTDLPDYFRFSFVQVVTEPCGSVVLEVM